MKKLMTFVAAGAIAAASAMPAIAQSASTSDPFLSTQDEAAVGSILAINGVTYVVVGVVAAGLIVALADGSSSTTTTIVSP